MKHQPFKRKKDLELAQKAILLYKQGLTTREVGDIVRRSHQWVALKVRHLSTVMPIDKVLRSDKLKVER